MQYLAKLMRYIQYLLILLAFIVACNPAAPPVDPDPDPPPTTTVPPDPDPDPDPDLPPDPTDPPSPVVCALPDSGRSVRSCYVTRQRAGERGKDLNDSTGLIREMLINDEVINTARNFIYVANRCTDSELQFLTPPINKARLRELANKAFVFHDGGREAGIRDTVGHPSLISFVGEGAQHNGRLERASRLCVDDPAWCGRTGVFRPALTDFRNAIQAHRDAMNRVDSSHGGTFDGIRHWSNTHCKP